jgi:hypothetical protein
MEKPGELQGQGVRFQPPPCHTPPPAGSGRFYLAKAALDIALIVSQLVSGVTKFTEKPDRRLVQPGSGCAFW